MKQTTQMARPGRWLGVAAALALLAGVTTCQKHEKAPERQSPTRTESQATQQNSQRHESRGMQSQATSAPSAENEGKKLKAKIVTSMGTIACNLFPDKAPKTVENFVGLAEGTKAWKDPKTGQTVEGRPLYKNVIFHRVISGFMIQGGDPLGNGRGGPGYQFDDEVSPDLTFAKPWMLAMANAGPNTNGSQFFITVAPKQYLNMHYSIFGECSEGKDVVQKISEVPTGPNDRPKTDVVIERIEIEH